MIKSLDLFAHENLHTLTSITYKILYKIMLSNITARIIGSESNGLKWNSFNRINLMEKVQLYCWMNNKIRRRVNDNERRGLCVSRIYSAKTRQRQRQWQQKQNMYNVHKRKIDTADWERTQTHTHTLTDLPNLKTFAAVPRNEYEWINL